MFEFAVPRARDKWIPKTSNPDVRNKSKQSRLSCPAKHISPCFNRAFIFILAKHFLSEFSSDSLREKDDIEEERYLYFKRQFRTKYLTHPNWEVRGDGNSKDFSEMNGERGGGTRKMVFSFDIRRRFKITFFSTKQTVFALLICVQLPYNVPWRKLDVCTKS